MGTICAEHQLLSTTISRVRLPLIFMIVLLHCYCAINIQGLSLYHQLVYPFGLWLGETGVPTFFFISGFLFFYSKRTYREKLHSRVSTLLIPYLFWNALLLFIYYILAWSGHPMLIAGRNVAEYGLMDYLRAFVDRGDWNQGNGVPLLCPFWYIRNLMVLCVLSPVFYYAIRYLKVLFILLLFGWWIMIPYNGMIASSILFFCMGAFFSIEHINPLTTLRQHNRLFILIWLTFFMADWGGHTLWHMPFALYVHRIALVLNIFAMLLAGSYFKESHHNGWSLLNKSAFWIYAVHYPLTTMAGKVATRYLNGASDLQVIGFYFLTVLVVTTICVVSFALLNKLCPRIVSITTGNRA